MASGKGMEAMKEIIKRIQKGGFDTVLKNVELLNCANGKCSAKFKVEKAQTNIGGGLHGGFMATLLDNITTYALVSKGSHIGVSVNMHMSFLEFVKENDNVLVDATTVRVGKNLAYIECELRCEDNGSIIAKGGQTKYVNLREIQL